ncbi:MAG: hypothetical protein KF770_19455 [Anaerolineae bacterium]|nr:hypothetical protein [Anaerolineae bacterium]
MTKKILLAFCVALLTFGLVQYAFSFSTGIAGFSGMNGGNSCNNCHHSGVTPEVSIRGPQVVLPGGTQIYNLVISGGQETAGGLNVAVTEGSLLSLSDETKLINGEIAHTAPKTINQEGDVVFSYAWTAPVITGTVTMYGAGNSVNGNGSNSGDAAGLTTLSIVVMELNEKLYLPMIQRD